MKIDLHLHSDRSCDGEQSPTQLIDLAKAKGLDVVSLTDHDTITGVKEMMSAGASAGIKVIPGIELSGQINEDPVHILGYDIDPDSVRFINYLEDFEKKEREATVETVKLFQKELDMDFDPKEMVDRCLNSMFALVPLLEELTTNKRYRDLDIVKPYLPGGDRADMVIANFYWDHCTKGKKFYVYLDVPDYKQLIDEVHNDGGLAILAHPLELFYENEDYLSAVIQDGIDGIEVYSSYHKRFQTLWYLDYAKKHDLLISGGSDYHGYFKPQVFMGDIDCEDDSVFDPLLTRFK